MKCDSNTTRSSIFSSCNKIQLVIFVGTCNVFPRKKFFVNALPRWWCRNYSIYCSVRNELLQLRCAYIKSLKKVRSVTKYLNIFIVVVNLMTIIMGMLKFLRQKIYARFCPFQSFIITDNVNDRFIVVCRPSLTQSKATNCESAMKTPCSMK